MGGSMGEERTEPEPAAEDRTRILRCGKCGKTTDCSVTDLFTYMSSGGCKLAFAGQIRSNEVTGESYP
jgi:hypothetical protein